MRDHRPRISLELSGTDRLLQALAITGWLAGLGIVLFEWTALPEQVPMHFDLAGKPNRWGPRSEIFVLPAISFVVLVGLSILSRFPHLYNYLVVITEQNAPRQYRLAVRLIQTLNLLLQWLFSVIVWNVVRAAQGLPHPGIWIVPVLVGGTFVLLIVYLVKASTEPSSGRTS